jgi:hypothetical protein
MLGGLGVGEGRGSGPSVSFWGLCITLTCFGCGANLRFGELVSVMMSRSRYVPLHRVLDADRIGGELSRCRCPSMDFGWLLLTAICCTCFDQEAEGKRCGRLSKVSVPMDARRKLMIPFEATHFAWAYPAVGPAEGEMIVTDAVESGDHSWAEIAAFAAYGGFVYFFAPGPTLVSTQVLLQQQHSSPDMSASTSVPDLQPTAASSSSSSHAVVGVNVLMYGSGPLSEQEVNRAQLGAWVKLKPR